MSLNFDILNQKELEFLNNSDYEIDFPGLREEMDIPRFTINIIV